MCVTLKPRRNEEAQEEEEEEKREREREGERGGEGGVTESHSDFGMKLGMCSTVSLNISPRWLHYETWNCVRGCNFMVNLECCVKCVSQNWLVLPYICIIMHETEYDQ
jgi:hypothetical protein